VHEIKEIKSMQVGEKVKLDKVFFKQSVAVLLPESYAQLDTLVMLLKELPTLEIEVQGHTDNQGDPKLNLQLSQQRVTVVKQYLVQKGISEMRLTEKGFGGNRAAVSNDTEENRRKNRRVEFMITKR
jgi:outer membrane protein OmpA-like peptidoglycan-associated protein